MAGWRLRKLCSYTRKSNHFPFSPFRIITTEFPFPDANPWKKEVNDGTAPKGKIVARPMFRAGVRVYGGVSVLRLDKYGPAAGEIPKKPLPRLCGQAVEEQRRRRQSRRPKRSNSFLPAPTSPNHPSRTGTGRERSPLPGRRSRRPERRRRVQAVVVRTGRAMDRGGESRRSLT